MKNLLFEQKFSIEFSSSKQFISLTGWQKKLQLLDLRDLLRKDSIVLIILQIIGESHWIDSLSCHFFKKILFPTFFKLSVLPNLTYGMKPYFVHLPLNIKSSASTDIHQ